MRPQKTGPDGLPLSWLLPIPILADHLLAHQQPHTLIELLAHLYQVHPGEAIRRLRRFRPDEAAVPRNRGGNWLRAALLQRLRQTGPLLAQQGFRLEATPGAPPHGWTRFQIVPIHQEGVNDDRR